MRPDEIAAALRSAVRERAIPPGHAMNQDLLAKQYGVSRIPLREALRTLVGEGLVVMKPGLGAVVAELEPEEVSELYGLRLQLEPPLAVDVVHHVGRRDIQELAVLVESMKALGPEAIEEWSGVNYRFDRRFYELSHKRHAVRLVVQVLNLVEPYARMHAHVLGSRDRIQAVRASMVELVRAGDAVALEQLVHKHIEDGAAELLAAMPPRSKLASAD